MKTLITRIAAIAVTVTAVQFIFQTGLQSRVFSSKTRMLIFDFQPIGVDENDARTITELISAKIVKHNVFTVIDRTHLDSIMKEHELQKSGFTTHEGRMKLGRMLNSEKLMHGSVSRMSGIYYITIKITDIVKGTIEWSDAVKIRDLNMIDQYISVYLEKIVRDDAIDGNIFMGKSPNMEKTEGGNSGVINNNKKIDPFRSEISDDKKHNKSSWYIGFGMGQSAGRIEYDNGKKTSIKRFAEGNENDTTKYDGAISLNFGIGFILNRNIHFGFDYSIMSNGAKKRSDNGWSDEFIQTGAYMPVVTFFPFSKGFFTRAGIGGAHFMYDSEKQDKSENIHLRSKGIAMVAGTGYAFFLYKSFNLCINLDYSRQYYAKHVKRSDIWNLYVSFYWF